MSARPAGFLRFAIFLAATASAACPDRISYFSEFKQWEEQDVARNGTCAISWGVQSFIERWPLPLDLGRESSWLKGEESLRRCLFPQIVFNASIDTLLDIAQNNDLGVRVLKKDGLIFLVVGDCNVKTVACIDEKNKIFNVDIDYGDIPSRKPSTLCVGDGCRRWEKRKEELRSEVVRQIALVAERNEGDCKSLCFTIPSAFHEKRILYCGRTEDDQRRYDALIVLMKMIGREEASRSQKE